MALALLSNALAEAKPALPFRHSTFRLGGCELFMVCHGVPMHDETGNLTGYRFVSQQSSQIGISDDPDDSSTTGLLEGVNFEARLQGLVNSLVLFEGSEL